MASVYEIKRFKTSQDKYLTKALDIYHKNIEPVLRTNTNEILYWLDNYNNQYTDRFYLLGFFLNDELIGFTQIAYFVDEKLVFVDYIVIDKLYRRNNTFYELVESIRTFTTEQNLEFNYIVGEVGYLNENKEPSETTRNLIRLLKMSGFGVVKTPYYQPMLGKNNFESELQSVLMIYTSSEVKKIKKETFLFIIETIYYKHYKRWFDKFFTEKEQSSYNERLTKLLLKIELDIKKKDFVEINGYSHLYSSQNQTTSSHKYVRLAKVLGLLIVFLVLATLIGAIVVYLKTRFSLEEKELTFISIASFILLFVLLRVFYVNKGDSIMEIIERVIKINK